MTGPFLTLALLIVGAVSTFLLTRSRPRHVAGVAPAVAAAACVLWLFVGSQLPLGELWAGPPGTETGVLLSWTVDRAAWQVSLFLLLLLVSVLLMGLGDSKSGRGAWSVTSFLLVAAGLVGLWAGSLPVLLSAWTLLGLLWTLTLAICGNRSLETSVRGLAVSWGGLFFAALGAANLPASGSMTAPAQDAWPAAAIFYLILAAVWQIWFVPVFARRMLAENSPPASFVLVFAAPAACGALLLYRLVELGASTSGMGLLLTLLGFPALIWAVTQAWLLLDTPAALSKALWFAAAGFVLLAVGTMSGSAALHGIWVWLLAGGILLLLPALQGAVSWPNRMGARVAFLAGPAVAVGAIAGFPLTAGFAARSAAYDAWATNGNWLSLLAVPLLSIPFIAAVLSVAWSSRASREESGNVDRSKWRTAAAHLALIIPAIFLLTPIGLDSAGSWSSLLILLGVVGGAALFLFRAKASELYQAAQATLPSVRFPTLPVDALRRAFAQGVLLLQQAAAILEGEWGLLWLLLLFATLLLLR